MRACAADKMGSDRDDPPVRVWKELGPVSVWGLSLRVGERTDGECCRAVGCHCCSFGRPDLGRDSMEGARDGDGTGALAFSVFPLSGGGHAAKFAPGKRNGLRL
jgi:hypothetical protein